MPDPLRTQPEETIVTQEPEVSGYNNYIVQGGHQRDTLVPLAFISITAVRPRGMALRIFPPAIQGAALTPTIMYATHFAGFEPEDQRHKDFSSLDGLERGA